MGYFDPNNNPPRRGVSRLIIAIVLILFALFSYWSHSEKNPVTGEKQHVAISPNEEIRLGIQSAPEMAKRMGGELPSNDPRLIEVNDIGALLVSKTIANKSPWKFQFHLLKDPNTINAFALPGGQIFITIGLLNKLENEAQLAGVLSHEMGHVIERHSAQQMAKSQLGQLLVNAVVVGSSSDDPNHPGAYSPAMIAAVVNQMTQLHFSRQDESQADIWGLKLMSEVGFDPAAMIKVMEILKASGGRGHMPEFFQTHPDPDHRIAQIKEYLQKNPPSSSVSQGRSLQNLFPTTRPMPTQ